MTDLVMLGATGHLRSVGDSLLAQGIYRMAQILDDNTPIGTEMCGGAVTGRFDRLPELFRQGYRYAFVSAGSIGNYDVKRRLYEQALALGFTLVNIIDPTAAVARNAVLGKNVFIGKNAVVNSYAVIEDMACINTGAIVEHNGVVEQFATVAPGCTFCGAVHVCRGAHVGAGSTVLQEVTIGEHALVGVGSVVTRDIPAGMKAYGVPCRVVGPSGY